MNTIAIHPAEPPPNEKAGHDVDASRPAKESEAFDSNPTAETEPQPAPPHKPALPLLSDRAYALRLDRIRLETAALMRHCLARVAAGEGRVADAASAECEAASLELAAVWLREAEGDGTESGEAGPFAARHFLGELLADSLRDARRNFETDRASMAAYLQSAAAYRLALAVLAEGQTLDNPGQLRIALAA